jgi:adenylate kinase
MTTGSVSVIVLLGAPGAGKGTVAQHLNDRYDVHHFSTGNMLRNEVQKESGIGKKVKGIIGSGGLVGDDIVNEIVEKNIEEVIGDGKLVILDGYPRTKNQAIALDALKVGALKGVTRAIEIDVDDELLVARISQRRVCVKCGNTYGPHDGTDVCSCGGELIKRKDDEESIVRNRLKKYKEDTLPVSDYYFDRLIKVSGDGMPTEVSQKIDGVLRSLKIEKRR